MTSLTKLFTLTMCALASTALGQAAAEHDHDHRSPDGEHGVEKWKHPAFSPCDDGSTPTCIDGSAPFKGQHPPCQEGKPTCKDGSKAKRPKRHGHGGPPKRHGHGGHKFHPCKNDATPTCSDGTAISKGTFPPCKNGKPICMDGTVIPTNVVVTLTNTTKVTYDKHGKWNIDKTTVTQWDDWDGDERWDSDEMDNNRTRNGHGRGGKTWYHDGLFSYFVVGAGGIFVGLLAGVCATTFCSNCRKTTAPATRSSTVFATETPQIVHVMAAPTSSKNAIMPYFVAASAPVSGSAGTLVTKV